MNSTFISIDPGPVTSDGRALSTAAQALRSSHTYDGVPGAIPYPVITSAVADFQQEWRASCYSVDTALDHLGRLAVSSAAGFQATDQSTKAHIWDRFDNGALSRRLTPGG